MSLPLLLLPVFVCVCVWFGVDGRWFGSMLFCILAHSQLYFETVGDSDLIEWFKLKYQEKEEKELRKIWLSQ